MSNLYCVDNYFIGVDFFKDQEGDYFPLIRIYDLPSEECLITLQQAPLKGKTIHSYAKWFYKTFSKTNYIADLSYTVIYEDRGERDTFQLNVEQLTQ